MSDRSIVVQAPSASPNQLVVLTHGVGSEPQSMLGLAHWFCARNPLAFVVSIASAQPSDISSGLQWFSVIGVTEHNRQARVDAAMPSFLAAIAHWQQKANVDAAHTTIAGFSQGAIMALESTKLPAPPAAEVFSFSGRFAELPTQRSASSIHLLHGTADSVMPVHLATAAHTQLQALGTPATLTVIEGIGHQPHPLMLKEWNDH
ncbi:esterase [Lampropedia puyangensis]|uniref:Esterase n=1 Tax=Lampropedia puyangensis TaxID=1330072 RepID=A0A4S8F0N9_9BURK|nr:esterase [Lampropedia puyangensis]THU00221.1 esterase [Lampropedia puyangensis]